MAFGQAIGRIQESPENYSRAPESEILHCELRQAFSRHAGDDDIELSFNSMTKQSSSSASAAPAKRRCGDEMSNRFFLVAPPRIALPASPPPCRACAAQRAANGRANVSRRVIATACRLRETFAIIVCVGMPASSATPASYAGGAADQCGVHALCQVSVR
jgi:hypothetical protein